MRPQIWLVTLALAIVACGREEPTGPVMPPGVEGPSIVLSAPIPRSALGDDATGTVVFVSARPGAFPGGARALLGREGAAASSSVPIVGGGIDATSLVASTGDKIVLTVIDSAGGRRVETGTARAPARPRVVRTSPASHRSDVPLNIVIEVAFSAPMDTASVSAALRLRQGGTLIPGAVAFRDADRTSAAFVPDAALEPGREYALELGGTVRDVLGQVIDASVVTTFSTAASPVAVPVPDLIIEATSTTLRVGEAVEIRAWACVQYYRPCEEVVAPISWTSDASGVVSVVPQGGSTVPARAIATGVSPGQASIIISSGAAATVFSFVVMPPPPATLGANEVVFARTNLYAIRADGTGLRQLTTVGHQSEPSVSADGRIAFVESPSADPYARRLGIREVDGSVRYPPLPSPQTWWPPRCPAWSPDMRYIAYLEVAPAYDSGILRVVHADSTTVQAAVSGRADMTCPKWSPTGELVTSNVPDVYDGPLWGGGWLNVWTIAGQSSSASVSAMFLPGEWSPDGREVATIVNATESSGTFSDYYEDFWIERRSVNGAAGQRVWHLYPWTPLGEVPPPAWSPDGSLMAFGPVRGRILLVEVSNEAIRSWGDTLTEGSGPTFVPPGVSFTR
jgi:Tol biopolymer transport system component